jgi:hypothetical protein
MKGSNILKNYEVSITHNYLLEAKSEDEAIQLAMNRYMGRKFKDVYFDGMVTDARITKRKKPDIHFKEFQEFKFNISPPTETNLEDTAYGTGIIRDRKGAKEQKYIHFDSTD